MSEAGERKKRKRRGERKDGLIQRSLVIGRKPDGSPDRKYFYGKTIAEADKKKAVYKQRLAYGMRTDFEEITVNQWIDEWYKTYVLGAKRRRPLSVSSKAGYKSRMDQLKASVGAMRMQDVREMHLQEALYAVRGDSKDAATKYAGLIKRVFARAKGNKIILDNPAEFLDTPDGTKGTHRVLQRWEAELILNHWQEHRAGLWAMVMMLAGLRRGELVAQTWENIDLEKRRITVCESAIIDEGHRFAVSEETKSPAGMRTLPICSALLDALLTVPPEKRHGRLCTTERGNPLSPTAFRNGWKMFRAVMYRVNKGEPLKQQGRRTDIEKKKKGLIEETEPERFNWRAHDLRFTFATAMYDAGVPVKAAQYYMGHADIRLTLDLYTTLSAEREKESNIQLVTFLDNWLNKGTEKASIEAPWEDANHVKIGGHDVKMVYTTSFNDPKVR